MRPNQPSTPSLSLLYTAFQPRSGDNNNDNHPYNTSDYYSAISAPTSPLSSTSTITTSSPTLPSSPTSPSLSPTLFQHPRPISDKLNPSSPSHSHNLAYSTGLVLRRRPSNIDTLLRQERSRATYDAIERQGLDLLEPRPVDLDPVGIDARMQVHTTQTRLPIQISTRSDDARGQNRLPSVSAQAEVLGDGFRLSQPRFVMGGIYEVMEGRG